MNLDVANAATDTGATPRTASRAAHARASERRRVTALDITVLAGGIGPERAVSLESGRAVRDALVRVGHRVQLQDIDPDNLAALDIPADVVFIALHGEFGEDGTVQDLLDTRGVPYCGTGAAASRLAMDKVRAKKRFEEMGVPTPAYDMIHAPDGASRDDVAGLVADVAARFAVPAVVKPVASGSSVDTHIARTPSALQRAAADVADKYGAALVEAYVDGPELTVGILGDRALPVCEIRTRREFYDYCAKYVDDDTQYLFAATDGDGGDARDGAGAGERAHAEHRAHAGGPADACGGVSDAGVASVACGDDAARRVGAGSSGPRIDLPDALLRRIQQLSLTAHRALGCTVFSRVDWMVDRHNRKPYALEVNTIPGFTAHSLLPKAAAMCGITFDQLCQRIVELSITGTRS